MLGLISKSFQYLDKTMFLVHPMLEYGNVVWAPHFALSQLLLEKVQRRATKPIPLRDLPYINRLASLKLLSLRYRRWHGDIILMYKIVHGLSPIDKHLETPFQPLETTDVRYLNIHFGNTRTNFFSCRVVNMWTEA